jgi:hypothetical protein
MVFWDVMPCGLVGRYQNQMNPVPPFSGKWSMQVVLEFCYLSTQLCGVTSQKTVILTINAERTLEYHFF